MTLQNYFGKLLKFFSRTKTVSNVAIRKTLNIRPKEELLAERQQELMEDFYYAPMKALARAGSDNTYSFSVKPETPRAKFNARGAFLHKADINEPYLLDFKYYENHNNLITATLNNFVRMGDRTVFRNKVVDILLESNLSIDVTRLEQADRAAVLELTKSDRYWKMFLDNIGIIMLYFYDQRDLTFVSERFFRSLFKCIALEEQMKDSEEKENLRVVFEEQLFLSCAAMLFPLSLAAYSGFRDSLPRNISDRMSPVKFKLRMIQQDRYDSPWQVANARGY